MNVNYYQLRFELHTGSKMVGLELENPDNALVASLVAKPENSDCTLDAAKAILRKQNAEPGSFVFDLAVSPEVLTSPLDYSLMSRDPVYLKISDIPASGMTTAPIFETRQAGDFALDLRGKLPTRYLQAKIPEMGLPKMLWAFYYLWCSPLKWKDYTYKDRPVLGYYNSNDPDVLRTHVQQAKSAGIDGFLASWWGPHSYTDDNLYLLLSEARKEDFKICLSFETDGTGQDPETIYRWLSYAIDEYGEHSAFMRVNGKPVVVVWNSGTVPLNAWKSIFDRLRQAGKNAVYIAMGYDNQNLAVFDGLHEYNLVGWPDLAQKVQIAGKGVKYYPLLTPGLPKIWAATVMPGYDDRLIPNRAGRFQDREDGRFYRDIFDLALKSNPDWIFITSWNEWPEHSYIEPSQLYGDQYLRLTKEFADKWKR